MSTFKGLFDEEELKHIAADYFGSEVFHCEAFFLSHAHTDHMYGLNAKFGSLLKENSDKKIYCSAITKELFSRLDISSGFDLSSVIELDIGRPNLLTVHGDYMSVTLIPAGHCPGSVMFLFEIKDKCVIFTGDFRYDASDMNKLKLLRNSNGTLKKIDNIYLDTTFAYEEYKDFPSRDQSLQAILTEVDKWLKQDKDNIVNLDLPARFGYEFVFVSIYQMFKIKVHVPDTKLNHYSNISEIYESVTQDPFARVHACKDYHTCVNSDLSAEKIRRSLTIRLCTMLFKDSFVEYCGGGLYKSSDAQMKLFYSNHCSLNELREFVKYLSPTIVTPFVINPCTGVTKEILTQRVLKASSSKLKTSPNKMTSLECSVNKKPKLEFHVKLNIPTLNNKISLKSETEKQEIRDMLMKYTNPESKLKLDIESPPSSPD